MSGLTKMVLVAGIILLAAGALWMKAAGSDGEGQKEIEAFNKRYVELHLRMDTAGILALWEEDGVDLMPGDAALIGRKKI